MIRAFSGAVPRPDARAERLAPDQRGVGADARRGRARDARARAGACRAARAARRPRSASVKRSHSGPSAPRTRSPAAASSTTIRPAIPRCRPRSGPSVVGLDPHRLAAAVRRVSVAADERVGDLPGACGPADVGVAVVDGGDAAAERPRLDQRPRSLDLGKLRHTMNLATLQGWKAPVLDGASTSFPAPASGSSPRPPSSTPTSSSSTSRTRCPPTRRSAPAGSSSRRCATRRRREDPPPYGSMRRTPLLPPGPHRARRGRR